MTEAISWAALLTLMVHPAEPEPTLQGRVASNIAEENFGWAGFTSEPPVFAGLGADAEWVRVWRDGRRVRIENPDGRPTLIADDSHCWQFEPGHEIPLRSSRDSLMLRGRGIELLVRRAADDFVGDDFTRPAGPIGSTTFLDRPCWTVELAPPPHKPAPLQLVVDAETGIVLQQRNDHFDQVREWVEIVVGQPLNQGLFRWDGPARTIEDRQAARQREHEADMSQRRKWFAANVTTQPLRVEFELTPLVHVHSPDGSFEASLGHRGSLARRPRSDADWELGWWEVQHRWSDDRWDWALSFHDNEELPTAESIARLREQLGRAVD